MRLREFENPVCATKTLQIEFERLQDISKRFKSNSKGFKTFRNASNRIRNASRHFETLQNISKRFKSNPKRFKPFRNASKQNQKKLPFCTSLQHHNLPLLTMARKKKLRPGKGAVADLFTRFIKPPQPLIGGNKNHRSMVILEEEDKDDKGKKIYRFYYDGDEEKNLMWANHRYVKVLKEGDHKLLFGGPGELRVDGFKEPRIKWQHSKAKRLLVEDINNKYFRSLSPPSIL